MIHHSLCPVKVVVDFPKTSDSAKGPIVHRN